jgi:hypothetical protein
MEEQHYILDALAAGGIDVRAMWEAVDAASALPSPDAPTMLVCAPHSASAGRGCAVEPPVQATCMKAEHLTAPPSLEPMQLSWQSECQWEPLAAWQGQHHDKAGTYCSSGSEGAEWLAWSTRSEATLDSSTLSECSSSGSDAGEDVEQQCDEPSAPASDAPSTLLHSMVQAVLHSDKVGGKQLHASVAGMH